MANDNLIEYPQNATPTTTRKGLKVTLISLAAVAALTAGTFGGSAVLTTVNATNAVAAQVAAQDAVPAAPNGDATTAGEQTAMTQSDAAGAQAIATEQAAEALAAQQAAQQAAAAAAAQAAAQHHTAAVTGDGKHPKGTPLPFIPSSDPNNANGGDYEDPGIFCESGSASTVNGVPVCD